MTGPILELRGVNVWFGGVQVLRDLHGELPAGGLTAILGSVGSGKSTFLRLFNRLAELEPGFRKAGKVLVGGEDVDPLDPSGLRQRVGMIFDRPSAFPGTIQDNVAFGLQLRGGPAEAHRPLIEAALRKVELWDEVGGDLSRPASTLSPGQRQRLCMARALAVEPEVLLLDEPTGRLHPADGARIEQVAIGLCPDLTVVFVTLDVAQAGRIADHVVLLDDGRLIEDGPAEDLFTNPRRPETQAYLSRRFG